MYVCVIWHYDVAVEITSMGLDTPRDSHTHVNTMMVALSGKGAGHIRQCPMP